MKRPKDILSQPYHIQEYIKYLESNVVLDSVMLSETLKQAEQKADKIDEIQDPSGMEAVGFSNGADWVVKKLKEKVHLA